MDHSATFARHFARLVWLLMREPANVDEQKGALRALVTVSRAGPVTLERRSDTVAANDAPVSPLLPGIAELRERMATAGVLTIDADEGAAAADLLGTARRLAGLAHAAAGPTVRVIGPKEPAPAPPSVAPLDRLEEATSVAVLTPLLDELARAAESAVHDGSPALAADIFHRIVHRERANHDFDARRAFVLTVRRLSQDTMLRAVAEELVRSPAKREERMTVLARAGEDGADAVIDQLVAAPGRSERRVYFDALLQLRAGVPTLVHMLGDPRWFVARNAAVLLGELQAREAEQPLGELLHHDDERVRHAATIALMRLGTPRSMPAIEHALRDGAPEIRMQAAAALAERRGEVHAAPLIHALGEEKNDEVKAAFLLALGRLGSPEAVERLIVAAQPERGLFRKKVVALRVAAVQGLAAAGTPLALDALVRLQADREHDVQEAALYALVIAGNEAWGKPERPESDGVGN